jgi:epoxyqueuosine reductase
MNTHQIPGNLLLHTCCAHCTELFLDELSEEGRPSSFSPTDIILYFDNSNIHPRTEYLARLKSLQTLADRLDLKVIVADWTPKKWFEAVGNWKETGRAERCKRCWRFRLEQTAKKASALGVKHFSTTMITSEYMDVKAIKQMGTEIADENLTFVASMKGSTHKLFAKGSTGYYMQNYCGCAYSLMERYEEKFR